MSKTVRKRLPASIDVNRALTLISLTTIEKCDRLFIVGTTLATYSAFRYLFTSLPSYVSQNRCRLVKHALELNKPVLILNVGPSRADGHPGVEKIELASGVIMREVVKAVMLAFFYGISSFSVDRNLSVAFARLRIR